jgi:hypothetical protein
MLLLKNPEPSIIYAVTLLSELSEPGLLTAQLTNGHVINEPDL